MARTKCGGGAATVAAGALTGANTTISFGGCSSVVLLGFADPNALHTSDFVFA